MIININNNWLNIYNIGSLVIKYVIGRYFLYERKKSQKKKK